MQYTFVIIDHSIKETEYLPYKEPIATVEFSHGDLIELKTILEKANSPWGKSLLENINDTLNQSM